jgi:MFS family permease
VEQSSGIGVVRRLVIAECVTRLGDAVTVIALPLTAVLVLGSSPAELALIGAAQAIPILLMSIPAGVWVDRRARRWPLMVVADLARGALLASIPVAAATGFLSIPYLAFVAFAASVCGTVFDVSFAGWVPRLLSGDRLHLANARIELARSVAQVGGVALGGALVSLISAPVALLADAVSFVASGALVASMRGHEPAWAPPAARGTIRRELSVGVAFVARQPLVRATVATAGINNLTRSIAMAVAILYLVDVGRLSPAEIGVAFALGNSGYLIGAVIARRLSRGLGMGWVMQLGVGLFGPSMLVFALAPAELAGVAFSGMVFAHGIGIAIHSVNYITMRQILTPGHLLARVAAVNRLVIFGAIPVGTVIGGLVAEAFGLRTALVLGGIGLCAGAVPYLIVRVTRLRTMEELVPAEA